MNEEVDVSEVFKPSAGYSLEYTLLGGELYSRVHTYYANVTVKESEKFSTEAIYEYRDHKYWNSDLFQSSSIRTGYQNTVGIKQNFYSGGLSGDIYYFSDFDRTRAMYWAFNGYRAGAELTYKLSSPLYIDISGEYSERRYRDEYLNSQKRRLDKMQQYSLRLTYLISKRVGISITESYTINDSNLSAFDYKRSIAGILLTVGVL